MECIMWRLPSLPLQTWYLWLTEDLRVLDKNLCSSFALRPAHSPLYSCMRNVCTMNSDLPGFSKYIHHLHSDLIQLSIKSRLMPITMNASKLGWWAAYKNFFKVCSI